MDEVIKTPATNSLNSDFIKHLRLASNHFGGDSAQMKIELLKKAAHFNISNIKFHVQYHDCLLFLLAYAENKKLFDLANAELLRVAAITRQYSERKNERLQIQLTGTGMAFTQVNVAFSFDMAKWLANSFPHDVSIMECDAGSEVIKDLIRISFPKAEAEFLIKKIVSLEDLFKEAKGESRLTDLQWLLKLISEKNLTDEIRDHLYDSLKIYVQWHLNESMPSRTFARSLPRKIFYQEREINRHPDAAKSILKPITRPVEISSIEKNSLVETARGILCTLQRETDPVTYADVNAVQFFSMDRGVDIALYPMIVERRLPFDSYIGYIAFKNRLPVAYGGGWIFQQRSKIGVHVFEPYRGGESAFIFCQILRLYHNHYGVNRFVVEPYQIGKNNAEGIKSGAFWFYYRLGFLPVKEELRMLAATEYERILEDKGYRSSLKEMKKLILSNLELVCDETGHHHTDVSFVSEAVTKMINSRFQGDRMNAETTIFREIQKFLRMDNISSFSRWEQRSMKNFSLLLSTFTNLPQWNETDRRKMVELIRMKGGGSEWNYIRQFQKHRALNEALSNLKP
ncbi:MAG: hypothetical protein H0V61_03830 [Chitinophagales bacterium]|nr:hypothetical protein [Chitinophagales bacterium]